MLRAIETSSEKACSAVDTVLPPGVFITMTPRRVAASTSTLSTPTPARPTTFNCFAASTTFAVIFVCDRTTIAEYSAAIATRSLSLSPSLTSTRSCPPLSSDSTPFDEIESATRTLGLSMIELRQQILYQNEYWQRSEA